MRAAQEQKSRPAEIGSSRRGRAEEKKKQQQTTTCSKAVRLASSAVRRAAYSARMRSVGLHVMCVHDQSQAHKQSKQSKGSKQQTEQTAGNEHQPANSKQQTANSKQHITQLCTFLPTTVLFGVVVLRDTLSFSARTAKLLVSLQNGERHTKHERTRSHTHTHKRENTNMPSRRSTKRKGTSFFSFSLAYERSFAIFLFDF